MGLILGAPLVVNRKEGPIGGTSGRMFQLLHAPYRKIWIAILSGTAVHINRHSFVIRDTIYGELGDEAQ